MIFGVSDFWANAIQYEFIVHGAQAERSGNASDTHLSLLYRRLRLYITALCLLCSPRWAFHVKLYTNFNFNF